MKVLTLVSSGMNRPDRQTVLNKEASDEYPRVSLYERTLNSDMLDEKFLEKIPAWRKLLYKPFPFFIRQVLEAFFISRQYDVVVTWAERLCYPFALLLKLTGKRVPHITLNSWISHPKKRTLLKFTQSHIDKILMWSSVQRNIAINHIGIPATKIEFIRKFADQQFFRPMDIPTETICAVGSEMRDYPTLVKAMNGLDIHCHIATGTTRGKLFDTVKALYDIDNLPANITIGAKGYFDLRDLYARSRFVVVPILPTDTDNGLTCILESMAMGKAVICSRTQGQVDIIQEGVTGIFVPPQDHQALRDAILYLWKNPELAVQMGKAARKYLEEHHTLEQFIDRVKHIIETIIKQKIIRYGTHT